MKRSIVQLTLFLAGILLCFSLPAQEKPGSKKASVFKRQEFHQRGGLPNLFYKIKTQRQVRIGYIGGSITEAKDGWRDLTFSWFRLAYPQTSFYQINATIGGTGSNLGVFRMEHDMLEYKPDLLFVEFAVNDSEEPRESILRSMEGIVRKTWAAFPNTDICFIYTTAEKFCPDLMNGKLQSASQAMEELAEHYGIASIHVGMEIARLYAQGKLILSGDPAENAHTIVFTKDHTHPLSESGHPLYASVVVKYLDKMSKKANKTEHQLPLSYIQDNWQDAKMIDISQTELKGKWIKLSGNNPIVQQESQFMPSIYQANPGSSMHFKFKGKVLGFYDCIGPGSGSLEISVDGKKQEKYRFDQYCSSFRKNCFFVDGLSDGSHEVEVSVSGAKIDKAAILSKKGISIENPAKYSGLDWYPANVMIVGELLK
jgi:hypothetical protein